jgi:hypothetical protein
MLSRSFFSNMRRSPRLAAKPKVVVVVEEEEEKPQPIVVVTVTIPHGFSDPIVQIYRVPTGFVSAEHYADFSRLNGYNLSTLSEEGNVECARRIKYTLGCWEPFLFKDCEPDDRCALSPILQPKTYAIAYYLFIDAIPRQLPSDSVTV